MSKKCRAYSESKLGLEPPNNRKSFYAGWEAALEAAPAQQAEPVKHQHKWFRTGAMEPGQMRCIDCGKWGKEQAEPVEPGAWVASKDGRVIYDDASKDDSLLRVSGDFENDEQRISYAKQIVDKLNAASAQQKDPTDPGHDVDVLREHVRHLERRVRELHAQKPEPVQMHPSQFAELIKGKEAMIGVPVYWSEWPTKETQ